MEEASRATHPPASRAPNPYWQVGEWRGSFEQLTHLPLTSRENTPSRDVALLQGGQNPISLEYQIYPPSTSIDTLVTGMLLAGG